MLHSNSQFEKSVYKKIDLGELSDSSLEIKTRCWKNANAPQLALDKHTCQLLPN